MSERKRLFVAILLFTCFVLVFTFNDKIVHNDLYYYGLQFNEEWAVSYWVNYFFMYELAIFALTWASGWNVWFFVFSEFFVIWTNQDIMFFIWCGYFPSGEWTWMWQYYIFGTWTTQLQFLSALMFCVGLLSFTVFKSKINKTVRRKRVCFEIF